MRTKTIIDLYIDGFKNLSALGKKLWFIIILKFLVLFLVIKWLFFPDVLHERFKSDAQRAQYVLDNLTKEAK